MTATPSVRQALQPFADIADAYDRAYEQRKRQFADERGPFAGPPLSDGHRVSISLGECRTARAALAAEDAGGWRDISTAPKDGTKILAVNPESVVGVVMVMWTRPAEGWNEDAECWCSSWDETEIGYQPTLWQPLPAAPETPETKEQPR